MSYSDDEDWAEPVLLDSAVLRSARKDPTARGAQLLKKVFEYIEGEKMKLVEIFFEVDTDGDGKLALHDLEDALEKMNVVMKNGFADVRLMFEELDPSTEPDPDECHLVAIDECMSQYRQFKRNARAEARAAAAGPGPGDEDELAALTGSGETNLPSWHEITKEGAEGEGRKQWEQAVIRAPVAPSPHPPPAGVTDERGAVAAGASLLAMGDMATDEMDPMQKQMYLEEAQARVAEMAADKEEAEAQAAAEDASREEQEAREAEAAMKREEAEALQAKEDAAREMAEAEEAEAAAEKEMREAVEAEEVAERASEAARQSQDDFVKERDEAARAAELAATKEEQAQAMVEKSDAEYADVEKQQRVVEAAEARLEAEREGATEEELAELEAVLAAEKETLEKEDAEFKQAKSKAEKKLAEAKSAKRAAEREKREADESEAAAQAEVARAEEMQEAARRERAEAEEAKENALTERCAHAPLAIILPSKLPRHLPVPTHECRGADVWWGRVSCAGWKRSKPQPWPSASGRRSSRRARTTNASRPKPTKRSESPNRSAERPTRPGRRRRGSGRRRRRRSARGRRSRRRTPRGSYWRIRASTSRRRSRRRSRSRRGRGRSASSRPSRPRSRSARTRRPRPRRARGR